MTETTRFVSKTTGALILAIVIAAMVLLLGWANERYALEVQRECMSGLTRPDPTVSDYDNKMLEFTSGVRECLR
jgi:hypothetical protein